MSDKPLKMVKCGWCDNTMFIPGDLPPLGTEPCTRCGHPVMMPMQLRQFELRSLIGSGGNGNVYRAWDTTLERFVAIKLMKKELMQDPKAMEGFYREARACAKLNHTNIIHIYTFDEWEEQQYLVMELADRGSLDQKIDKLRLLPELESKSRRPWIWRSNTICSIATSSPGISSSTPIMNPSWWILGWPGVWKRRWKAAM
jgi:serine/threonine-protein kinase